MKTVTLAVTIYNQKCTVELMSFNDADRRAWKVLFDSWKKLKLGMREYKSREPNIPEGLSEVAYCLWSGSNRFIKARGLKNTSFDTFNLKAGLTEQIKACSVEDDLTSFGPRSKWDRLIFLDFYREGRVDGMFDVYEIPTEKIYNFRVNKNQTFRDQQLQGKRPRLHIKNFIKQEDIKPIATAVKVWL